MIFQVTGPKCEGSIHHTPEAALREASRILPMPKQHEQTYLEDLRNGKIAVWAYGFNEVWITPIVQGIASVTGE